FMSVLCLPRVQVQMQLRVSDAYAVHGRAWQEIDPSRGSNGHFRATPGSSSAAPPGAFAARSRGIAIVSANFLSGCLLLSCEERFQYSLLAGREMPGVLN